MLTKKVKLILSTSILAASLSAYAAQEQVACPSVDLIKQSWEKLDTVSKLSPNKFAVWSIDNIKDGGYAWHITTYANASDMNEALKVGQDNVKNVTGVNNHNASDLQDVYLCTYVSQQEPMGVAAISFKIESQRFKFASFNFK